MELHKQAFVHLTAIHFYKTITRLVSENWKEKYF